MFLLASKFIPLAVSSGRCAHTSCSRFAFITFHLCTPEWAAASSNSGSDFPTLSPNAFCFRRRSATIRYRPPYQCSLRLKITRSRQNVALPRCVSASRRQSQTPFVAHSALLPGPGRSTFCTFANPHLHCSHKTVPPPSVLDTKPSRSSHASSKRRKYFEPSVGNTPKCMKHMDCDRHNPNTHTRKFKCCTGLGQNDCFHLIYRGGECHPPLSLASHPSSAICLGVLPFVILFLVPNPSPTVHQYSFSSRKTPFPRDAWWNGPAGVSVLSTSHTPDDLTDCNAANAATLGSSETILLPFCLRQHLSIMAVRQFDIFISVNVLVRSVFQSCFKMRSCDSNFPATPALSLTTRCWRRYLLCVFQHTVMRAAHALGESDTGSNGLQREPSLTSRIQSACAIPRSDGGHVVEVCVETVSS